MHRYIIFIMIIFYQSGCTTANYMSQNDQIDDLSSEIKIFNTYSDAIKDCVVHSENKMLTMYPYKQINSYVGYSLLPFGSAEKSKKKAIKQAVNQGEKLAFVTGNYNRYFKKPPGDNLTTGVFGGTYSVFRLHSFGTVDITEENIISEIKGCIWNYKNEVFRDHLKHLTAIAKNENFTEIASTCKELINEYNSDNLRYNIYNKDDDFRNLSEWNFNGSGMLIELYAVHEGESSIDTIKRWAKYHKRGDMRMAAYSSLIMFKKIHDVEEILAVEKNQTIKAIIEKKLVNL